MAEIVLGIWTTHGPQLSTTPEQWMLRIKADRARKHWFKGEQYSFEELAEMRRDEELAEKSSLEGRTRSHAACQAAMLDGALDHLKHIVKIKRLGNVVVRAALHHLDRHRRRALRGNDHYRRIDAIGA